MLVDNGDPTDPANDPTQETAVCPDPEDCFNGLIGFLRGDTVKPCPEHRPALSERLKGQRARRRNCGARRPVPAR